MRQSDIMGLYAQDRHVSGGELAANNLRISLYSVQNLGPRPRRDVDGDELFRDCEIDDVVEENAAHFATRAWRECRTPRTRRGDRNQMMSGTDAIRFKKTMDCMFPPKDATGRRSVLPCR
jgi:hypothetical protein